MAKYNLMERYSNLVDSKLRNQLVLKDGVVFNNKYEGDPKSGAVKVRKTGESIVRDYDVDGGLSLNKASSEWITVEIDKDKAINEIIDGYEASAVPDGIVADRLDAAAYGLANQVDKDGAIALVEGATELEDTAPLTKKTIYAALVDVRTQLSKNGVPDDNRRYVVVSPDTFSLILNDDDHFTHPSDLGDKVVQTGAIGKVAGMLVFESANLGEDVEFVAGHPDFATRINEWMIEPKIVSLDQSGKFIGASAVQGRKVYAHKVTNKNAIFVKKTAIA